VAPVEHERGRDASARQRAGAHPATCDECPGDRHSLPDVGFRLARLNGARGESVGEGGMPDQRRLEAQRVAAAGGERQQRQGECTAAEGLPIVLWIRHDAAFIPEIMRDRGRSRQSSGPTVRARFCNRSTRLHYLLQQTAAALPSGDMKKSS
jgi:hypothetical protein